MLNVTIYNYLKPSVGLKVGMASRLALPQAAPFFVSEVNMQEDLIDFPCSEYWRSHYARRGMTRAIPEDFQRPYNERSPDVGGPCDNDRVEAQLREIRRLLREMQWSASKHPHTEHNPGKGIEIDGTL